MRIAIVLLLSCITGCASFESALPSSYAGPTAVIEDTIAVTMESTQVVHIFDVREVDGRRVRSTSIASASAKLLDPKSMDKAARDRGGVIVRHQIPAVPVKLKLAASTQFAVAATTTARVATTCREEGYVAFAPRANVRYVVNGIADSRGCTVWVEEADTFVRVTDEIGVQRKK